MTGGGLDDDNSNGMVCICGKYWLYSIVWGKSRKGCFEQNRNTYLSAVGPRFIERVQPETGP